MRRLGDLEAEIMDRLWTWDRPATVREVVDDINKTRPVAAVRPTAALMEDGLGESKDRSAALRHFVENMSQEEVAALRRALRNMGRQTKP
ncbi:BlaI/MecI/CopY family transcriptional regulator [Streptomyces mirabilis]|uniref:BlaI/MecI/CopY family transcriptional regulator n=1 Tax=Streptomyces mirabilis TaxID=68239 RepID=UPI003332BBBB